jgi:hypothetical protein
VRASTVGELHTNKAADTILARVGGSGLRKHLHAVHGK